MAKDPNASAAKWAQNLQNSTQAITDGVNAVTVAPGLAAARQKDVYVANVMAAKDKWASRVASVPLSSWQQSMIQKGIPRIAQGATVAQPKVASFLTQLLPAIAQVKSTLPPRGTLDQNINRSNAFIRGMAQFSYKPTV